MNFRLPHRSLAVCITCFVTLFTQSPALVAQPWIDAGDERSRHHLQVLADAGLINLPLTSWPVMWSGVSRELDAIDLTHVAAAELWSYQYLRHELRRAERAVTAGQMLRASSSRPGIVGYGDDSREQLESRSYATITTDHWAFKLQASAVGNPIDDQRYRVDGSYIAGMLGNWAIGVGAIDRWWGPGWQTGLVLSDNARPSPGVFVSRVDNQALDFPVLEWLGPWDLRLFLNQLEHNRRVPRAKLLGMRFTFKPFQSLELGLSRTALWGGDDPSDGDTFWNRFIAQNEDGSEYQPAERANHLTGADWRLGHSFGPLAAAFYGEVAGDGESGDLPDTFIGMSGVEASFLWGSVHNRLALEASNTTMNFDGSDMPNVAYERSEYPSGYRYKGRPLGASTDNDSELLVLKGWHNLPRGQQVTWTLGSAKINVDDNNNSNYAGNVFGGNAVDLWYATAQYAFPVGKKSQVSFGGQYYNKTLQIRDESIDSGVYITYELRL